MSDPRCKCTMSISMTGDGCRYCQPQEHIERMCEWLNEEREENLTLRQKLHHMAQTDRAVYTRASELSDRVEAQKETIFNIRQRVQKLKNLTQGLIDAWDCGDNDDLQRACGAIVDYVKEKGHD